MINNYAKNNLLPSPVRKKYTQEHILLLVFIYYFKNLLSFTDIETVLSYITENHFGTSESSLAEIYTKVFSMEHDQMDRLKEDVKEKFEKAKETFPLPRRDRRILRMQNRCALRIYLRAGFRRVLKEADDRASGRRLRDANPPGKKRNNCIVSNMSKASF